MGKGSQTVTQIQKLPPGVEEELTAAYETFTPFQKAMSASQSFNPGVYTGSRVAGLSNAEQRAINSANSTLGTTPSYLLMGQAAASDMARGNNINTLPLQIEALQSDLNAYTADTTALKNLVGSGVDTSGLDLGSADLSPLANLAGQTVDTSPLANLQGAQSNTGAIAGLLGQNANLNALQQAAGAQTNTNQLNALLGRGADLGALQQAATATTDTSALDALANQQNSATGLLSNLASGSTNPYLQNQLATAISGAVDKATSQYAQAGRLGSNAFASSLGSGITNAAAPILAQNLQQDRAAQLAAAQALGSVSAQDLTRQLDATQSGVAAQQTDLARALQGQGAVVDAQNAAIGRDVGIAGQVAGIQQSDLARALQGQGAVVDAQNAALGRDTQLAGMLQSASEADLARAADIGQSLLGVQQADLARQTDIGQSLIGAQQTDLARQLQGAGMGIDAQANDLARQSQIAGQLAGFSDNFANRTLDADTTSRQLGAQIAGQLADASQAEAAARANAAQLMPSLLSADASRIQTLAQLGGLDRGITQATLDARLAQQADANVAAQNRINALLAASGMGSGLFSETQTSTRNPSALETGTSVGLTLAALANAGIFSDPRLKTNVTRIGRHKNGLNVYSWDWNDVAKANGYDTGPTVGFMADEARAVYPEHVTAHESGYLMLNYTALNQISAEAA